MAKTGKVGYSKSVAGWGAKTRDDEVHMMTYTNMVTRSMSKEEEFVFIEELIEICVGFLKTWKVTVSRRTETTDDAFVAVTELEAGLRKRLAELAYSLGRDLVPF